MIRVSLHSAITGVIILTVLLGGLWGAWSHQQGLANLEACGTVQPGGRRSVLIATFGAPQSRVVNPAGTRLVLFFRSPFFAERPIRAVVNIRDDVVMEVDCGDGRINTYDKY